MKDTHLCDYVITVYALSRPGAISVPKSKWLISEHQDRTTMQMEDEGLLDADEIEKIRDMS